jgi:hypothetical protein
VTSQGPIDRVRTAVGPDAARLLDSGLRPADLASLLLATAKARAAVRTPAQLVSQLQESRFVRPATCDPRQVTGVEHRIWQLLPLRFAGVDLSPVAPLGSCSVLSPVDQNLVVSTMRGTEVVSDPTNVLALEAAVRRKQGHPQVELAAVHRVLRAQVFAEPGASAHFRLFALVSTARARGSGATEAELVASHLEHWRDVLEDLSLLARSRVDVTVFRHGAAAERITEQVVPALERRGLTMRTAPERSGAGYYGDVAVKLFVAGPQGDVEIGDGGLVPWTALAMNDAKERAFVSCAATERMAALV